MKEQEDQKKYPSPPYLIQKIAHKETQKPNFSNEDTQMQFPFTYFYET